MLIIMAMGKINKINYYTDTDCVFFLLSFYKYINKYKSYICILFKVLFN